MKITLIKHVKSPTRGTSNSAGLDFYVPYDMKTIHVSKFSDVNIPSGVKAEIPKGYMLKACNKSSIALKGLIVGADVIDEDYQGEIHMHVYNRTNKDLTIKPGTKLVQFILIPVLYENINVVEEIEMFHNKTKRGEGGFGSTGI